MPRDFLRHARHRHPRPRLGGRHVWIQTAARTPPPPSSSRWKARLDTDRGTHATATELVSVDARLDTDRGTHATATELVSVDARLDTDRGTHATATELVSVDARLDTDRVSFEFAERDVRDSEVPPNTAPRRQAAR